MKIEITIITDTATTLEMAVQSAQHHMPTFTPYQWGVTATVEADDNLSLDVLMRRLREVPGIQICVEGASQ